MAVELAPKEDETLETDSQVVLNDAPVSAVPEKYRGLPSQLVEEMWSDPQFIDPLKNQQLALQRDKAIEEIKVWEQAREGAKTKEFQKEYTNLAEEQKKNFIPSQKRIAETIAEFVKGDIQMDGLLSTEELWVLNKAKDIYEKTLRQNPEVTLTLQFDQKIDREIYGNLVNRLTFASLSEQSQLADREKANGIRKNLGIKEQDLDTTDFKLTNLLEASSDGERNSKSQMGKTPLSEENTFELSEKEGPCVLKPVGDVNYLYVVMPIKST